MDIKLSGLAYRLVPWHPPIPLRTLSNTLGKSPGKTGSASGPPRGNLLSKGMAGMQSGFQRAPLWLQELFREFTKPPYFLQQKVPPTNTRTPPQAHSQPDSTRRDDRSPAGRSARSDASSETKSEANSKSNFETNSIRHVRRPSPGPGASTSSSTSSSARKTKAATPAGGRRKSDAATKPSAKRAIVDEETRAWQAMLRQADFPVTLPALYGWEVTSIKRVSNVVHIYTTNGEYALKRTHIPPERVVFLEKALDYLQAHDFTRFSPIVSTTQNRPFVHLNDETYYATKWLPGQAANFSSISQVGQIAQTLAQFHEASKGFSHTGYRPPNEFRLQRMMRERAFDIRELLAIAEQAQNPSQFDKMFLELGPSLRKDAEKSLRLLENEACQEYLQQEEQQPGLCHLDVIPNNFVYDGNHVLWLLDFDLSTFAPRVLDEAHLLRRSLQRTNWDTEAAYACFLQYNAVRAMSAEEYVLVQALLTFPYQAWRIANTHYRVFQDSEQVLDLEAVLAQETRRQTFLDAFAKQITRVDDE